MQPDEKIIELLVKVFNISAEESKSILSRFETDLKKLRLFYPINFLLYIDSKLPKDEKILRTLFYISTLESVVAAKKSNTQKVNLVSEAIKNHLSNEEKTKLLGGFLFSDTYQFGEGRLDMRHLMFQDMMADQDFNRHGYFEEQMKYCSTGHPLYLCRCVEWLVEKEIQDNYIPLLVRKFNEMRGAMLHEGFPVLWFPDFEHDPNITMFSATLVDAHPTESDPLIFRSYESGIDSSEFYEWIRKIVLGYIKQT